MVQVTTEFLFSELGRLYAELRALRIENERLTAENAELKRREEPGG